MGLLKAVWLLGVVVIGTVPQVRSRGSNSPSACSRTEWEGPQGEEEVLVVTAMGWNLFLIGSPLVEQEDLVGWHKSGQSQPIMWPRQRRFSSSRVSVTRGGGRSSSV